MMGFSTRSLAVLLVVALVGLSLTEARKGRGGGGGRGARHGSEEDSDSKGSSERGPGRHEQGSSGSDEERSSGSSSESHEQRGSRGHEQRGHGGEGHRQRGHGGESQGHKGPEGPGGSSEMSEIEIPDGELYAWNQTLSTGDVVVERVFVPENKSLMVVSSRGNQEAGFVPARTLYDFSGPRAGTQNATAYGQENLDGTSEKLPLDATAALYEAKPELKRFCGLGGVVIAAPLGDLPAFEGETRNITVLTYDSEVTLTVPVGIQGRHGRGHPRS
ncbi:hypothetical protein EGW08_013072 [Elysia chlorotica]|uniref:SH3 domain-containing protein n=1 Tax=Elysia chlorotica TaxID=188477 RepID=A0A433TCL3_ELYCH|nr:hypothetical protein EGW08_013072 [Elysia chlorotica]